MRRIFFLLMSLIVFVIMPISAQADFGPTHQNQFPYPDNTAVYEGEGACEFEVYYYGAARAGNADTSDGYFYVYMTDLNRLTNTASQISGSQNGYIYLDFYDDTSTRIWSGVVPVSSMKYQANAERAVGILKINDASLQAAAGDSYNTVAGVLSSSLLYKGGNWMGKCLAPRSLF